MYPGLRTQQRIVVCLTEVASSLPTHHYHFQDLLVTPSTPLSHTILRRVNARVLMLVTPSRGEPYQQFRSDSHDEP